MTHILHFAFVRVHDPDSEDKFFSIVIIEDAVQVITKSYRIKHHADYDLIKITHTKRNNYSFFFLKLTPYQL